MIMNARNSNHHLSLEGFYLYVLGILKHSHNLKKILKADQLNSLSCAYKFLFMFNLAITIMPKRLIHPAVQQGEKGIASVSY